jgi:hypothetical protein
MALLEVDVDIVESILPIQVDLKSTGRLECVDDRQSWTGLGMPYRNGYEADQQHDRENPGERRGVTRGDAVELTLQKARQ